MPNLIKKMGKIYQVWVKKLLSKSEWNACKSNSSYCFLKKDMDSVWAGFLIGNPDPHYLPDGCFPMLDEELRQVDEYRRSIKVAPYPLEDIGVVKEEVPKSSLEALAKVKNHFGWQKQKLVEKMSVSEVPEDQERKRKIKEIPF